MYITVHYITEHDGCINSASTLDADRHSQPIGVPGQGVSVTHLGNQPDFRNTGFSLISFLTLLSMVWAI